MDFTIAILDISGAVAMVSLMAATTCEFGFRTPTQRWALARRFLSAMAAVALFARGVIHLGTGEEIDDVVDLLSQIAIVAYMLSFPMMRALGLISQDRYTGRRYFGG